MGWPSVEWGLKQISSRELSEWRAYYQFNPFGQWRGDYQAGVVAAAIINMLRNPEKSKPVSAMDLIPQFGPPAAPSEDEPNLEALRFRLEMLNAAFGGKDLRNGNTT